MKVAEHLLQSLEVSLREMRMSGSKDVQSRCDILTRANNRVLVVAEEAGEDVLRHSREGRGVHVREAKHELGSIGRDKDLQHVMPCLAMISRKWFDKSKEICGQTYRG
jgi:translation initiation factor 6 (eIF-6)